MSFLKFDIDDLFYYSSHKILKRQGHLYVNDYGMQITILNRYGIKNYGVREYWIVDPQKETVMVYHFPEDATPSLYPLKGRIPVGIFNNELEIDFDEFRDFILGGA